MTRVVGPCHEDRREVGDAFAQRPGRAALIVLCWFIALGDGEGEAVAVEDAVAREYGGAADVGDRLAVFGVDAAAVCALLQDLVEIVDGADSLGCESR
ncbi:hypothetical protein GCM10029992_25340 [Glycomyces albus]